MTNRRLTDSEVLADLAAACWRPPAGWSYEDVARPIPGTCSVCGHTAPPGKGPKLTSIRQGNGACNPCGNARWDQARRARHLPVVLAALAQAQWIPDAGWTYEGNHVPIPGHCAVCGYSGKGPTAGNLRRRGSACLACAQAQKDGGLKPGEQARVYLVAHRALNACKVGITNARNDIRLDAYTRRGWRVVDMRSFNTGTEALVEEQRILTAWRQAGFPPYLTRDDMPMGGWTETAQITALEHWALVA